MSSLIRRYWEDFLAKEKGTIVKDWGGKIRVCLIFPNYYNVGISNLGFQYVYALFNARKDVVCERAFLPEPRILDEHKRTNIPLLSLESLRPLRDFHILAFSLSYENDYPNVLQMLELSGIPLLAEERKVHDPLVIAGGSAMSINPEVMAPFFDCILIGEAEELVDEFIEALKKSWGKTREELLKGLSAVEGVYVPQFYEPILNPDGTLKDIVPRSGDLPRRIKKRVHKGTPLVVSSPLRTKEGEFGDSLIIEVARGCPHHCRFCVVRSLYHPFRPYPLDLLEKKVIEGVKLCGRVSFLGAAIGNHPDFLHLCHKVIQLGGQFTLSSLRADQVSETLAKLLFASNQRSVTFAPEVGREEKRFKIGKRLSDSDLFRAVQILSQEGVTNLKLYFMIGLPKEEEEDLKALINLVKEISHKQKQILRASKGKIILSLSSFVPKPWTPFQWYPFEEIASLKKKIKYLKRSLEFQINYDLPKWAYFEALFSLGDRRIGLELYRGWKEGDWIRHLRVSSVNPDFWVLRKKTNQEFFPWEILSIPISKADLWEEFLKYERA
jgi:radical SAM superfamily enzyme YgiQ (UPF0313 family)